ncbi:hypothetical protein [Paenibacillus dauci]|uniref:hypothetical protein n=1 Tax=Paenibacillus dauci TaxID=1567106 RepID=UPI0006193FE3|nr:hypothetical protein [Paenibacillus dauci]
MLWLAMNAALEVNISMTIEERKQLRTKLLHDLYDYHFGPDEKSYNLPGPKKNNGPLTDKETRLAYDYLSKKGLIEIKDVVGFIHFSITPYGIDVIEEAAGQS